MDMSYEEWHTQTAALLLDSHVPKVFVEEYLANRAVLYKLYEKGFTAAEVSAHLSKQYAALKSKQNLRRLSRIALILLFIVFIPAVCYLTYRVVTWLGTVFEADEGSLVFALLPCGVCALPIVVMVIVWLRRQ